MTSPVTHFEIYGEEPAALAEFYRQLFGWRLERAPGVDYWRIETGASPGTTPRRRLTHPVADGRYLLRQVISPNGGAVI